MRTEKFKLEIFSSKNKELNIYADGPPLSTMEVIEIIGALELYKSRLIAKIEKQTKNKNKKPKKPR